jgi:hypothetical protein
VEAIQRANCVNKYMIWCIIVFPIIATPMFIALLFSTKESGGNRLLYGLYTICNWSQLVFDFFSFLALLYAFRKLKLLESEMHI